MSTDHVISFFSDDMAERVQREVVLHDVDAAALQLLVDYAYTGEIHITEDNVQVNTDNEAITLRTLSRD